MADKKGQKTEEPEVEASGESEEKSKASNKRSPLPMIIGAVIGIAVLGGGGWFLWSQLNPAEAAEEGEEVEVEEITQTNIYFDGFATNIANLEVSSDYDYLYLKYGFEVEVSNNAVINEIVAELPRLTARVSEVMSNRNYNEICTPQSRERVANDAMRAMNDELESGEVIGVYFHTFVAQ